jgi:hypothetical protein
MDMFNVKRRDNPSMDRYSDLKKPAFGGPKEKEDFDKSKRKSLDGYQRVVDRNADFEGGKFNHNYDTTWKAVTRDLISRTAKKKPFDPMYAKPTIATVDAVEEGKIKRFEQFVNENEGYNMFAEAEEEAPEMEETPEEGAEVEEIEVDEEQLENLMADFGEDLEAMIEDIAEKMEIEKEEVCNLLCAAVKKLCLEEESEEGEEDENEEDENEEEDEMM